MFGLEKRVMLFLLACIPARIILASIPCYINKKYLRCYGLVLLVLSLGFLYLYFNNLRLNAPEGGGKTWWSQYRLIHGLLYLSAAIYAIQEKRTAWVPLTIDVAFGLGLFIQHHFI